MNRDEMTVGERYSVAVHAGRLDSGDAASATDLLVAMAWTGNDLGPVLYRLRAEVDVARSQRAHALEHQRQLQDAITAAGTRLKRELRFGPSPAAGVLVELQAQAPVDALLDRIALLERLPTLPAARDAVGRWAEIEANRYLVRDVKPHPLKLKALAATVQRDMARGPSVFARELDQQEQRRQRELMRVARTTTLTPQSVRALAGGVLQAFIDPSCQHCGGRGRRGGNGMPETTCRPCRGTGLARDALQDLTHSDEQRQFGLYLLAELERMFDAVDRRMRAYLRDRNLRG